MKTPLNERILIPILSADTLLSSPKHQKIINDISQIVDLPDEEFSILYKQLIFNFAQFVQLIPLGNEAELGGIVETGLARALTAIQLQKKEELNNDIDDNTQSTDSNNMIDPLMTYTLFSAALLFDIGSLTHDRTIIISKEDGTFVKEWLPHKGAMQPSDGSYYRIRHGGNKSLWLSRNLTPILAKQLIPIAGFNWIAADPTTFDMWLSLLLNHKENDSNPLKHYFKLANKNCGKPTSLRPLDVLLLDPQTTSLGEDFLEWLREGIKNKTLEINNYNADIHVIENGLFIETPTIIEKFCLQSSLNPPITQVVKQLEKIGFLNSKEITKYTYKNQVQSSLFTAPATNHQKKTAKYNTRDGLELLAPYFLSIRHKLKLTPEKNFIPDEIKKEKKKKLLILKRRRQRKLKILRKELEEAMQVQAKMNLGIKD